MSKGFGQQKRNPIADAAQVLHTAAQMAGKPLVIPMFPAVNDVGLQPGQLKPGHTEIRPSCDGIVIAVHGSAEDSQELIDLIMDWQHKKLEGQEGGDRNA